MATRTRTSARGCPPRPSRGRGGSRPGAGGLLVLGAARLACCGSTAKATAIGSATSPATTVAPGHPRGSIGSGSASEFSWPMIHRNRSRYATGREPGRAERNSRVSTNAAAYVRGRCGSSSRTRPSQHCSSSSRNWRLAHHTTGCHQKTVVAARSRSRTRWSPRRIWQSSWARIVRLSLAAQAVEELGRQDHARAESDRPDQRRQGEGRHQISGTRRRPSRPRAGRPSRGWPAAPPPYRG